jgi:hypothetical protein
MHPYGTLPLYLSSHYASWHVLANRYAKWRTLASMVGLSTLLDSVKRVIFIVVEDWRNLSSREEKSSELCAVSDNGGQWPPACFFDKPIYPLNHTADNNQR